MDKSTYIIDKNSENKLYDIIFDAIYSDKMDSVINIKRKTNHAYDTSFADATDIRVRMADPVFGTILVQRPTAILRKEK